MLSAAGLDLIIRAATGGGLVTALGMTFHFILQWRRITLVRWKAEQHYALERERLRLGLGKATTTRVMKPPAEAA